ncbi:esterase-like activity of phytase family protein [Candidatus Cyanaurora vandensis]|uniref:esterase-like activity of phytase family protein n=1 Tax=Candidatus Cyanaurora vandensis TaxID=2714958 RepID=UPI00257C730A|nr:esterase-like activity of phytase family protein [Candidatus Cyanaurora vandensis]
MKKWLLVFATLFLGSVQAAPSTVTEISYLGQATFPTGTLYNNTQVGGLSGITYDSSQNLYYSIADDRSVINPARYYTLTIDLSTGTLNNSNVVFTGVTTLLNGSGQPFAANSIDPEGIALTNGTLFISSEGEVSTNQILNPFVNRFTLAGLQTQVLPIPTKFLPGGPVPTTVGIRNNLAFESLTLTPDQTGLYTATENALVQDGPTNTPTSGGLSRILRFNLTTGQPEREFLYRTEPVAQPPIPAGTFSTSGLVELLAVDDEGTFLALERSFSTGVGNSVKLFEISLTPATDISGNASLSTTELNNITPVRKRLVLDLNTLGITLDNLEGLTFGPNLSDGRRSLIIVSDNNFSPTQFTQFLAFGVRLAQRPILQDVLPGKGYAGESLTLTGANFTGASQVTLNGTPIPFTVLSDTQLTATVPTGATSGPLTITTTQGTGTSAFNFKVNTLQWQSVGAAAFGGNYSEFISPPGISIINRYGPADILWRNQVTGENAVWVLDQGTYQGAAAVLGVTDLDWVVGGTVDITPTDLPNLTTQYIFWRNRATGENAVWRMAGPVFFGATFLPNVVDLDWEIVGTGDFNSDFQPDLLWRNRVNGANSVWILNNGTYLSTTDLLGVNDLNWEIGGAGDFNSDRKADILWRNRATGENAVWFMDGASFVNSTFILSVLDLNWEIAGAGDFNGDFRTDILWYNRVTGENAIWFMDGINYVAANLLPTVF